jgi:hypothetical protein
MILLLIYFLTTKEPEPKPVADTVPVVVQTEDVALPTPVAEPVEYADRSIK